MGKEKETEKDKVDRITSRFEELKQARKQFEGQWEENEQFVSTSVYEFLDLDSADKKVAAKRFTSTPGKYMRQEAAGIVGYSASRSTAWLRLDLEDPDAKKETGVNEWLAKTQSMLMSALRKSNFYSELYLGVRDGATYGHCTTAVEWDKDRGRVRFSTRKLGEMYLDNDEYGDVDTVYREYSLTLRQAAAYFGLENLSSESQSSWDKDSNRSEKIKILEAVERNGNWTPEADKMNSSLKRISHVYIEEDKSHVIREDGYDDFPYACLAWEKIPSSPYAISPTEAAIIDIKALNKITEAQLKITQTSATPPLMVPEGLAGASLNPGAQNPYTAADKLITPIKTGENYQIVLNSLEIMENKIKYHYDVDFFQMLASAQANMTATEVTERQGEKATILGPLIENIGSYLEKLIERAFGVLMDNGALPAPPPVLQQGGLKIEFTGTLAQAQKKYYQSGGVMTALGECQPVFQMNGSAMDNLDTDKLTSHILEASGIPNDCIRSEDEVEKIRTARIQAQQAAAQAQQQTQAQQTLMQNYDKINKPVENGSPLQAMTQQLAGGVQR